MSADSTAHFHSIHLNAPQSAISAVLITRNAAEVLLEPCLESALRRRDRRRGLGKGDVAARHGARVGRQKEWLGFGRKSSSRWDGHDWVLCGRRRARFKLRTSVNAALAAPVSPVYRMARRNQFWATGWRTAKATPTGARVFNRRERPLEGRPGPRESARSHAGTLGGDLMHLPRRPHEVPASTPLHHPRRRLGAQRKRQHGAPLACFRRRCASSSSWDSSTASGAAAHLDRLHEQLQYEIRHDGLHKAEQE